MNFLSPKNWSRFSRENVGDSLTLYKYRRIILLSQFTLFGAAIGVVHALEDLIDGMIFMPVMDFTMAVVIFLCYLLNEKGFHRASKLTLLGFLNLFFFVYSSLAEPQLGIFLYYFPWIGLAAVIFESDEKRERFFFIALSVILLIVLFATKFDAFGETNFGAVAIGRSYVINLVSSIIVLVFFIVFMIRMNEDSERRLYDLAEEIKVKNSDLEKSNAELDKFMYSASHDLRSPLMSIKGLVEIIQSEVNDPKLINYMQLMHERIAKLDDFICDIIDYSRNVKTELDPEPVYLNELVEEIFDNLRFMEGASLVKLIREIQVEESILIDRSRLMIVLNNLIANAIKYRNTDASESWVKFHAQMSKGNLIITITDNGQGVAPEHQEKVFNMFYRATAQSKGSGLGLYIVKETLDKLRGSISMESVLDKGTTFTLTIPVDAGDTASPTARGA